METIVEAKWRKMCKLFCKLSSAMHIKWAADIQGSLLHPETPTLQFLIHYTEVILQSS